MQRRSCNFLAAALGTKQFSHAHICCRDERQFFYQGAVGESAAVLLKYGVFLQSVVDFVIIAFAIFLVVKAMNSMKKKEEDAPAVPSAEETLLGEFRDLPKQK